MISAASNNSHLLGISLSEVVQALAQYQSAVEKLPLPEDEREIVTGDFEVVSTQLQKPEPKKHLILPKLESILKIITAAGAASEALPNVIAMGEKVVEWVKVLL